MVKPGPGLTSTFSYVNYLLLGITSKAIHQILLMSSLILVKERETGTQLNLWNLYNLLMAILGKFFTYFYLDFSLYG